MMFGITTALDLCRDQTLGQCVSHYTAGSALFGYAIITVVLVHTSGQLLRMKELGVSRELVDGVVMAVAGVMTVALGGYRPGAGHVALDGEKGIMADGEASFVHPHTHAHVESNSTEPRWGPMMGRHEHHAAAAETESAAPVGWMHIVVVSLLLYNRSLAVLLARSVVIIPCH